MRKILLQYDSEPDPALNYLFHWKISSILSFFALCSLGQLSVQNQPLANLQKENKRRREGGPEEFCPPGNVKYRAVLPLPVAKKLKLLLHKIRDAQEKKESSDILIILSYSFPLPSSRRPPRSEKV